MTPRETARLELIIYNLLANPDTKMLLVSRDRADTFATLSNLTPSAKHYKTEYVIRFDNNSELRVTSHDGYNIRGLEFHGVFFDDLT